MGCLPSDHARSRRCSRGTAALGCGLLHSDFLRGRDLCARCGKYLFGFAFPDHARSRFNHGD